jgi:hypothetical protein
MEGGVRASFGHTPGASAHGTVPVRDSKNQHGPALHFQAPTWTAFVTALRNGRLSA